MKKGFTLIEVLVVAVIVAILAAVAIPSYQTYIDNAAESVADNMAATIASEIAAVVADTGSGPATLASLKTYTSAIENGQIASVAVTTGAITDETGVITVTPTRAGVTPQTCAW